MNSIPNDLLIGLLAHVSASEQCTQRLVCSRFKNVVDSSEFTLYRQLHGLQEDCLKRLSQKNRANQGREDIEALPGSQTVVFGTRIINLGGSVEVIQSGRSLEYSSKSVVVFDAKTKTWQQGSPMSVPRKDFACGVIGDMIIVAGGEDWSLNGVTLLSSAEMYSVEDNVWHPLNPLKQTSGPCMGVVIDGKFHVLERNDDLLDIAEVWTNGGWEIVTGLGICCPPLPSNQLPLPLDFPPAHPEFFRFDLAFVPSAAEIHFLRMRLYSLQFGHVVSFSMEEREWLPVQAPSNLLPNIETWFFSPVIVAVTVHKEKLFCLVVEPLPKQLLSITGTLRPGTQKTWIWRKLHLVTYNPEGGAWKYVRKLTRKADSLQGFRMFLL